MLAGCCFNLVIERLLISGGLTEVGAKKNRCFNLVIERLLISGSPPRPPPCRFHVSISLSSGFSFQAGRLPVKLQDWMLFQSRYRAASHFRTRSRHRGVVQCMFQSRYRAASHFRSQLRNLTVTQYCFNLVIERLLISGQVSALLDISPSRCFNLVIERLLISGANVADFPAMPVLFQSRYRAASHFRLRIRYDE